MWVGEGEITSVESKCDFRIGEGGILFKDRGGRVFLFSGNIGGRGGGGVPPGDLPGPMKNGYSTMPGQ